MTSQDWSILIPAVVGVLTGVAGWLRAQAAHARIDQIQRDARAAAVPPFLKPPA